MTVLWILLGIFGFFALLVILPVSITLGYSPEEGLSFCIRYAGIPLIKSPRPDALSKTEATQKKASKTKKKKKPGLKDKLLSYLGLSDAKEAAKPRKKKRTLSDLCHTIRQITSVVKALFGQIAWLLKKSVFRTFNLRIAVGAEDPAYAASSYGMICAVVYPLLSILDTNMKFRKRDVDIRCDFDAADISVAFSGKLIYRPWHFLRVGLCLLWKLFTK